MDKVKPLSELPPEIVERWRKHMPPFADRPDLKNLDEIYRESQRIRQDAIRTADDARRQAELLRMQHFMGIPATKASAAPEEVYECPKCHRKTKESKLNYMKQRGKKQVPWCPFCNIQIYPEGDERVTNPAFVVKEKYGKDLTFKSIDQVRIKPKPEKRRK